MKAINTALMFLICFAGYAQTGILTLKTKAAAADQHKEIGVETSSKAKYASIINKDHWFSEAGLGMFIHFGLASLGGNHDLSWSMIRDTKYDKDQNNENKMKPTDYFNLARSFNPTDFCPIKWLKAAKDAGFEYAVLTTRHHDGFALWPSEYGDFNTKNYMNGRDLVKEYVDACRKNGIRVGFYYSPPDWYRVRMNRSWGYNTKGTKESPHLNVDWEPVEKLAQKPADFDEKNITYVNGQLRELLTRYGKIDYLWFDGGAGKEVLSFEEIKKLQPDIIINDRQHGYGDVMTSHFEGKFPKEKPDFVWEHCFIMNNSFGVWGYTKREVAQPNAVLLAHLALVRSMGGNTLANYGPLPTGDMPPAFYERMTELKIWMTINKEAIKGVEAGPYPERCNVPVVVKGKKWFLFLVSQNNDVQPLTGKVIITGVTKPANAKMLGTGESISVSMNGTDLEIDVPSKIKTGLMDVIELSWRN